MNTEIIQQARDYLADRRLPLPRAHDLCVALVELSDQATNLQMLASPTTFPAHVNGRADDRARLRRSEDELAALREDAARLDWLDAQCSMDNGKRVVCLPGALRAAIDRSRKS